jgi:hypothetical protein
MSIRPSSAHAQPLHSAQVVGRPSRQRTLRFIVLCLVLTPRLALAAPPGDPPPAILGFSGRTEVSRLGTSPWDSAATNQVLQAGDRVRTGLRSRAVVRLSSKTIVRLDERSVLIVPEPTKRGLLQLLKGALYLFHRDGPGDFPVETPTGYAAVLGTEFTVRVGADGGTHLNLIEGQVNLTNLAGRLELRPGEAASIAPGRGPVSAPSLISNQAIQWCLYYPSILWLEDLSLGSHREPDIESSLRAYEAGDLLQALALYPEDRQPTSAAERVYLAGLLLSSGQVSSSRSMLAELPSDGPLVPAVRALERMMLAVQSHVADTNTLSGDAPSTASEWLALSYDEQARLRLKASLDAAKRAVELAPEFAFGWARVAELEFSFGRRAAAQTALDRSLGLAPRNAQSQALRGFIFAAADQVSKAEAAFESAIQLDSGLANAWLGRGLMRIRRGDSQGGLENLTVAAAVEPQRASLRSYLGKGFAQRNDLTRAARELDLAEGLDPGDPTARLYLALIHEDQNALNQAIRDLELSQRLNGNRAIYRSRLLLDQDQSVRGANLARVFQQAGLTDVAPYEAARAIQTDYANYSSHLFLANTYDGLRDPNQVDLRHETPWLSEYLVANLLAPVGAGTLSQRVSQQEYSRLFERDRLGLVSATEYLSRGDWNQGAALHGVVDQTGFALDQLYRSRGGQRINDDLEQKSLSLQIKQQITPSDSVYLQAIRYEADGGDITQYYDPTSGNKAERISELQEPLLLAGWHHQWEPGSHTLFLAGRLTDTLDVVNPAQRVLVFETGGGSLLDVFPLSIEQVYRSELEIYTTEIQQIFQRGDHTMVAGTRYQSGEFETRNTHGSAQGFPSGIFPSDPMQATADFERGSAYLYEHWQVMPSLQVVGGLTFDALTAPVNHRFAPIQEGDVATSRWSPKGGLVLTPHRSTTLRAGYAQSLGGASLDQSFQLEPTQVAGFNQAWRSLIPESVAGANSGARLETWGVALDSKLPSETYLGLSLGLLRSQVARRIGTFESELFSFTGVPASTREELEYEDRTPDIGGVQMSAF